MNDAAKTAFLISAVVTMAFLFGFEVGAFEERQRRARLSMLAVLDTVQAVASGASAKSSAADFEDDQNK